MKKPGRNDICSCGSGKKFKQCCMQQELAHSAKNQQETQWIATAIDTAISYHQQGRQKEAQEIYESILKIQPNHAQALHFLGVVAYQAKQYTIAEELMSRSIAANPSAPVFFCNYATLLRDMKKTVQAVENCRRAVALAPNYVDALLTLGAALIDLGQLDEAIVVCRRTIMLQATSIKSYDNLGTALRLKSDFSGSIKHYEQAIQLDPTYVAAYTNLAATYIEVKNFNAVSLCCLKAIELDPNHANAYLYLGLACQEQGNLEESENLLCHAITLAPQNMNSHWNLGLTRLARGKLEQGWAGYEFRWQKETAPVQQHHFPYPWWQGESMLEKTILVWGEQGIGDQIMFAAMYEDVIARFKKCIIACPKKLMQLYSRSFPKAQVICVDEAHQVVNLMANSGNSIDVQSAVGSLARWLRPLVASFPKKSQFLYPDTNRVSYWKKYLADMGPALNVGICWRSSDIAGERQFYCTKIAQWGPILSVPGVRFINLQYDDCADELALAKKLFGIHIHSFPEVDLFDDLDEAAALTKSLDLVISAPTTAAILAGATGAATWMMVSGFNWQKLGTPENCWYSTIRTINKTWDQTWETTLEEIACELQLVLANRKLGNK